MLCDDDTQADRSEIQMENVFSPTRHARAFRPVMWPTQFSECCMCWLGAALRAGERMQPQSWRGFSILEQSFGNVRLMLCRAC